MKTTKKTDGFTEREWEELASMLSGEKSDQSDLMGRFNAEDDFNTGKQWKKLKEMNRAEDKEIDVDRAWNSLFTKLKDDGLIPESGRNKISMTGNLFLRIAAAALILLSVGTATVFLNQRGAFSKKITLITGNDQKNLLIDLPDGSRIYLNRNSEFSYHKNFGVRRRDVRLTGEAFFEIAPDKSKPFIIDAGKARVKVVGTSFNVITSNSDSAVEVYVKTGRVELSDNSGSQSITLDPEFVGTIDSKAPQKRLNNNMNYLSWKTGRLVYNGQKLDVVFNDLKRVYNMDIAADDRSILENSWTSPIDNQSPDTIIRLICISFNLAYTKDGNVYHLSKK